MSAAPLPAAVVADLHVARIASLAGWILLALALSVLSGWALHVPLLTSVAPGLVSMKANTAVSFLLAGLALIRRNHRDLAAYSLGVVLIGAASFAEYLFHSDFHIDQLLFPDPSSSIDPGRMSQMTSVAFILLGSALAIMKSGSLRGRRVSRALASLGGTLGFIAVLGYSYDTRSLYQVRPFSSMALNTAMAIVVASIGIKCANPAEGLVRHIHSDSAGGAMLRELLPAALLVPYLLGLVVWLAHKRFGLEMGFSLALLVAATMLCLVVIMLLNALRLEREDLALRDMNRTLEDRVRERTAQLAAQIRERDRMQAILDSQRAQMIAASKLTSLGEMAGGLAHEINSPLNIIQARASDLQELADNAPLLEAPTVVKATGSILRTCGRIMSVVRGLRTFARDGRADPFELASLQAILDDTLALCRERFAAHGIRVQVVGLDHDLAIECQRVQISQVLLNFLNNAFDAIQPLSAKWIRVDVSQHADFVNLAVTDSGHGIPQEIAEKATQPFFTTKPVGKGTGLGLSISNAIAQAHHGFVRFDPRGPNTRIVLTIPIRHTLPQGVCNERRPEQDSVVC